MHSSQEEAKLALQKADELMKKQEQDPNTYATCIFQGDSHV